MNLSILIFRMDSRERKDRSESQSKETSRKRKPEGRAATKPPPSKSLRHACFGSSDSSDSSDQEDEPMETDKKFSKYSKWLLRNVEGLTQPRSLLDWGGRKLAEWCNSNRALPVKDLPSQMQGATCPLLTPRLFVLHLKRYGGLLGLKRRMYLEDFQPVLQRLFDLRSSLHKTPFCLHRYIRSECEAYVRRLRKRKRTDHAFNRLNLEGSQQLNRARDAFKKKSDSCENKNARLGIDFSWLCLQIYHMTNSTRRSPENPKFCGDLNDLVYEKVKASWTNFVQFRFQLNNVSLYDKKGIPKSALAPAPYCRQLLVYVAQARQKGKLHVAAYLCARLLADPVFIGHSHLKIFRVYAWCHLAKSLAQHYVRLDAVLAFLDRALSAAVYPTDKLLVYNAKQHALAIYGCHLAERDLFEHLCREERIPRNSKLFIVVCANHFASVIRQNEDSFLECYCLKTDPNPSARAALQKKLRQIKNRSVAMIQFIHHSQFLKGQLLNAQSDFSIHEALALLLEGKRNQAFRIIYRKVLTSILGGPTYTLLHTLMCKGAEEKQSNFEKYQQELRMDCEFAESEGDWKDHVAVADSCYGNLACLLASGLVKAQTQHALNLVERITKIYESVSAHLTHHRLPALRLVRAVLLKEQLPRPVLVFPGPCASQKKANLKICQELCERAPADFLNSLSDPALLDYYVSRDAHYLKTILTFGKMSLQFCPNI